METPRSRFLFFFLLWFFYGHVAAQHGQMSVSEPETSSDDTVEWAVGKIVGTLWGSLILLSLCSICCQCMAQGADKTLIRMLPLLKFSMLRGSKEGLECIICLKRFEDADTLRLLPQCEHAFHVSCIDLWLNTRAICPLCGKRVTTQDVIMFLSQRRSEFLFPISSPAPSEDVVLDVSIERVPCADLSSSCKRPKWLRWGRKKEMREETAAQMEPVRENGLQLFNKFLHRITVSDALRGSRLNSAGQVSVNTGTRASESSSVLCVAETNNTEITMKENITLSTGQTA